MEVYQIRVTKDNGDYIILEEKLTNCMYIKKLYQWYESHDSFFNGKLSIERVRG